MVADVSLRSVLQAARQGESALNQLVTDENYEEVARIVNEALCKDPASPDRIADDSSLKEVHSFLLEHQGELARAVDLIAKQSLSSLDSIEGMDTSDAHTDLTEASKINIRWADPDAVEHLRSQIKTRFPLGPGETIEAAVTRAHLVTEKVSEMPRLELFCDYFHGDTSLPEGGEANLDIPHLAPLKAATPLNGDLGLSYNVPLGHLGTLITLYGIKNDLTNEELTHLYEEIDGLYLQDVKVPDPNSYNPHPLTMRRMEEIFRGIKSNQFRDAMRIVAETTTDATTYHNKEDFLSDAMKRENIRMALALANNLEKTTTHDDYEERMKDGQLVLEAIRDENVTSLEELVRLNDSEPSAIEQILFELDTVLIHHETAEAAQARRASEDFDAEAVFANLKANIESYYNEFSTLVESSEAGSLRKIGAFAKRVTDLAAEQGRSAVDIVLDDENLHAELDEILEEFDLKLFGSRSSGSS